MVGFISSPRDLLDWAWFKKPDTAHLFHYLLLKANHAENNVEGLIIKRAQLKTGLHALSNATGLSIQRIRTSLRRLKSTNDITITSTKTFSIITICSYDKYADAISTLNKGINKHSNKQGTKIKQASNKPSTINKNDKKNHKDNNENTLGKDFIPPEVKEVIAYFNQHGFDESIAQRAWESYNVADWHDSRGKPIKNWKQKMLQVWFRPENMTHKFGNNRGQHPGQIIISNNINSQSWNQEI